jgi:tetratricopeptide (TPR) repeat protein
MWRAARIWEESLAGFRQTGDRWGTAVALSGLSFAARRRGDYALAVACSEESLGYFREVGDKAGIASSLSRLGNVAFRRSDYHQAISLIEEGMPLRRELGEQAGLANDFALLGLIAAYQGDYDRRRLVGQSLARQVAIPLSSLMTWATGPTIYLLVIRPSGSLWRRA